ncbi:hypothetical protein [Streptomyces sp. NPDC048191]|uniref:hypothetical protein n=1 Tax=Streptomyces sp. NPDC048191 TaxID=3155484 RepID=UPI0033D70D13
MVPEAITALAGTGAGALVSAMASDAWQTGRDGAVRLFRRRADAQRALLEGQLDHHATLVERADDPDGARQLIVGQWQLELVQLLTEHPDAEPELRRLVEEVQSELPRGGKNWVMTNIARDHGTAYGVMGGNVIHYHQGMPPEPPTGEDPRP